MTKPVVALINESTCIKDEDVVAALKDLQAQVSQDFAPIWGKDADLLFIEDKRVKPDPTWWILAVLDDSDQAGALGYHEVQSNGLPLGKVFANTDLEYEERWTATLSHELLELICDPNCLTFHAVTFQGKSVFTIQEVCDAVEADSCGYTKGNTFVSDFVTPAYFDTFTPHPPGTKFDFTGKLSSPMTIASGGYVSVMNPTIGGGWSTVMGQHVPLHKRLPPRGSRRERLLLRENHKRPWQRSTAI